MKRIIPLLLLVIILCGCSATSTYSGSFFAMDTYMTITVCGNNPEKSVKNAEARVKKLDEAFSAHNKKSGVYKLNKNGSAELEPDAVELLSLALNNYRITDGAFNPAMLSVTELWGFPDKNYKVPSENEIKSAHKNVKPEKITVKNNTVKLNNKGIKTIVMEDDITAYLDNNKLDYSKSYQASRFYLKPALDKYPTVKLFIDLHRDSTPKDVSTTTIDSKNYAKVMFVIGKEYDTYESNLAVASSINDRITSKYPTLSRGVLQKEGYGVNGVYNQDLKDNIILIELGGDKNNLEEVTNTIDVLVEIIGEYINE